VTCIKKQNKNLDSEEIDSRPLRTNIFESIFREKNYWKRKHTDSRTKAKIDSNKIAQDKNRRHDIRNGDK